MNDTWAETQRCVHCHRQMGDYAGGFAMAFGGALCHPNASGRPDCYHLVTVYKHVLYDCPACMTDEDGSTE